MWDTGCTSKFLLYFKKSKNNAFEDSPEEDDVLSKKEEANKDDLNGYKASDNSRISSFSNTPGDISVLSNEYIFNSVNDVDEIIRKRFAID